MALGIMGGTFDPIHMGHLIIAEYIRVTYNLKKVIFIPVGEPPHKPGSITDSETRFDMVAASIVDNPDFEVSRLEMDRNGKTYTVDTIEELEKLYPGEMIVYIIGTDTLFELENWKTPEMIGERIKFIVYGRQASKYTEASRKAEELRSRFGLSIEFCSGPIIDISSSFIRARLAEGKSVRYLVPCAIESQLNNISLDNNYNIDNLMNVIKSRLGVKRFDHTLGVVDSAVELAKRYKGNVSKARVAALLHDIAKPMGHQEMLKIVSDSGIILDNQMLENTELLHGHIGAYIAESELGISDPEILDAIRFHTTGRENMTLLDKIIYLADFIEPGRNFPGVEEIRKIVIVSIDEAVIIALENTIKHLESLGTPIHKITLSARDSMKNNLR